MNLKPAPYVGLECDLLWDQTCSTAGQRVIYIYFIFLILPPLNSYYYACTSTNFAIYNSGEIVLLKKKTPAEGSLCSV